MHAAICMSSTPSVSESLIKVKSSANLSCLDILRVVRQMIVNKQFWNSKVHTYYIISRKLDTYILFIFFFSQDQILSSFPNDNYPFLGYSWPSLL